jgi:hypothetical protein
MRPFPLESECHVRRSRVGLRRHLVVAIAITVAASCENKGRARSAVQASDEESFTVMEQLAGPLLRDQIRNNCVGFSFPRIRRPPHDSYVPAEGCSLTTAETTHYVYRDETGGTLVTGIEILTAPERVREVLDSLRDLMVRRFGPPTRCSEHRSSVAPLYAWDLDTIALTAWADSGLFLFRAGLEARASERICDPPLRRPARE